MRHILRIVLIVPLLSASIAARQAPRSASVEGIVVRADNGAPLAGVTVELTGVASRRTQGSTENLPATIVVTVEEFASDGRVLSFAATTGAGGRFSIRNVPPGTTYQLVATHAPNYLPAHFGQRNPSVPGRPLDLSAGQQLQPVRIEMTPAGSISGRITGSNGKPIRDALVRMVTPEYQNGGRVLSTALGSGPVIRTNAQGEYRLSGMFPGVYYISAMPRGVMSLPPAWRGGRPLTGDVEAPTHFPGTPDPEKATPIYFAAGTNMTGIDIKVAKVRVRAVRGVVTDGLGGKPIRASRIWAVQRGADNTSFVPSPLDPRGSSFDIPGLMPGSYFLVAAVDGPIERKLGRVVVDIKDSDVKNVTIVVTSGTDVSGRVLIEGQLAGQEAALSNMSVFIHPMDPVTAALAARVKPNGAVVLSGVTPGEYQVELSGLTERLPNGYLKSIRYGTSILSGDRLRVDAGSSLELEFTVGLDGGSLEGRVLDERRRDVPNSMILLAPTDLDARHLFRTVTADSLGRFELTGVRPGDYTLLAWEYVLKLDLLKDPEFIRIYQPRGMRLRIGAGSHQSVEAILMQP